MVGFRPIQFRGKHPAEVVVAHANEKRLHDVLFCSQPASQTLPPKTPNSSARNALLRFPMDQHRERYYRRVVSVKFCHFWPRDSAM
jgi:hypothetical protein